MENQTTDTRKPGELPARFEALREICTKRGIPEEALAAGYKVAQICEALRDFPLGAGKSAINGARLIKAVKGGGWTDQEEFNAQEIAMVVGFAEIHAEFVAKWKEKGITLP